MASQTKKKKKPAKRKKSSRRTAPAKSKVAKKSAAPKKAAPRGKRRKGKALRRGKQEEVVNTLAYEPQGLGPRSGGQSGDLQGLSHSARANGESVDELLEEGNAFEAEIVKGVEDVRDADEGEIRTHEVPEDDVPEEYLENEE